MVATCNIGGEKCIFLKPQTYMNLSGEAVGKVMKYYKIDLKDFLVIYDDMDLPIGSLRLREKGSAGGHNGIKNIIAHLSTQEFKRIRVGISGRANIEAKDYVLGHFSKDDLITLELVKDNVCNAVEEFISNKPFVVIMGNYNGQAK
jgi:PTH1 family peptidyl-tRNA hydrolase